VRKKPVVLTYHNDITGRGLARYIARLYNATSLTYVLKRVDKIIITQPGYLHSSPYLKRYEHKIVIIPNGVDVEKFKPPSGAKHASNVLFFLSILDEFHRYKGLDILLKALIIVKKDIPDVKLIVGGSGELMGEYQRMANSLGLNGAVEFHGFIPDDRLVEYYSNSNVFVLPSISSTQEGFGIVLLEALACGTPVISTAIVGVAADVQANHAGIIIPPNDSGALADGILTLLRDAALAQKMGDAGRRLVEAKYTWEKVAAMTEAVYRAVLR
jgi:glycosyltransferase involved in cell wall biosynthesis